MFLACYTNFISSNVSKADENVYFFQAFYVFGFF